MRKGTGTLCECNVYSRPSPKTTPPLIGLIINDMGIIRPVGVNIYSLILKKKKQKSVHVSFYNTEYFFSLKPFIVVDRE